MWGRKMKMKEVIREKQFRVFIVEFDGSVGLVVEYRNRRFYLPPLVSSDRIALPLKYAELFDRTVFPEIVFVPYGRRE